MVSSISSTETSNEGSSVKKKKQHNKKRFLTGRQVSWMICEYFTFSDTDESVLDLSEFKKVEWKNNIQSFDALWDETRIATKKQPAQRWWSDTWTHNIREKHFSGLEKPACLKVLSRRSVSNESTIQRRSENPKGKGKGSRPSISPRRNSLREGTATGKSPAGRETQPTCFASQVGDCSKENALDNWHPPACSFPSMENRKTWE